MNGNPKPISDAELVGMMQRNQKAMRERIEQFEAENAKLRAELERLVPDGCLIVPIQPTEEMRKRAQDYLAAEGMIVSDWLVHTAYTEMLAAASSAPATVPDAIAMADVMRAWEYAEDHPHKYLRGTTNWCAAVAHSLNQQRVAAPSAPKADPAKVQLLEALEAAEKKLCIAEYHLDKGEDDSVVFESEILLARAAIAAARKGEGE